MSTIIIKNPNPFEQNTFTLVDNLTLEKIKIKYNWLLNAKIKDAIIGEDKNGLVWYSGDWLCGVFENGTWYNGNFYGVWKNGNFYSYKLNKSDLLLNKFTILDINNSYSNFYGIWVNGTFHNGTFGSDVFEYWENFYQYEEYVKELNNTKYINFKKEIINNSEIEYEYKKTAVWINGTFTNGIFRNSIWNDGIFLNGHIINSQWINGIFVNGIFEGYMWHNGEWYNGEFIEGVWLNGIFNKINNKLKSVFGSKQLKDNEDENKTYCKWLNGIFKNGDFYSGIILDKNNNIINKNNNISIWFDGVFENGIWHGGHFKNGIFKNGIFENGIFGDIDSSEWMKPKFVSQQDLRLSEKWYGENIIPIQTKIYQNVNTDNLDNEKYTLKYFIQTIYITNLNLINQNTISFKQREEISFIYDNFSLEKNETVFHTYDLVNMLQNYEMKVVLNNNTYDILNIVDNGNGEFTMTLSQNIYSTPTSGYMLVKRNYKLEKYNNNDTNKYKYLEFNNIISKEIFIFENNGLVLKTAVTFISNTQPNFNNGDFVYIEQQGAYKNEKYNGIAKVISVYTDGTLYYIVVSKNYGVDDYKRTGKIIPYLNVMHHRRDLKSSILSFQDFNFNYDFLIDLSKYKIIGYSVKVKCDVELNNSNTSSYKRFTVMLPFKGLYYDGIFNGVKTYNFNDDKCEYVDTLYNNNTPNLPNIKYGKNKNIILKDKNTLLFGGMNDMWGLIDENDNGLELYYTNEQTFFNVDQYNPRLLKNINDRIRISLYVTSDMTTTQELKVTSVELKVYYLNKYKKPIFENGKFINGYIFNSIYNNSDIKSAMIINSILNDVKLSI